MPTPPHTPDAAGITRRDTRIESYVHQDAYADRSDRHRVLLLGGLTGDPDDESAALAVLNAYATSQRLRNRLALSAIPRANPDGNPTAAYPPQGGFFDHQTNPESRYLWRYVGFMAPDLVLEIRAGDAPAWQSAGVADSLATALNAAHIQDDDGILTALSAGNPNELGTIPGLRLTVPQDAAASELMRLTRALDSAGPPAASPARAALADRRARTPLDVASALVPRYGDTLTPVIYTQGVAISGRLRYAALTDSLDEYAQGVADLVEPYLSSARAWFSDSDAGANHAGLVWCDEMHDATGDARYRDLLISIADLYRGNAPGEPPPPCDPDYRTEDFFFSGALMGRAYALTGDVSYLDIQTQFLLNAEIQHDDGMFRHCRAVPYYWGRGNGFAALGYAETLTHLPADHPDRPTLIDNHTRHLTALRALQRPDGMFTQLLDEPGTYRELTSVCMVGYAVARGVRLGWLDESWRPFAQSLWRAASERIGIDGSVVDGCAGTGAVNDRRFYIDRPAESGQDDRTGNLSLWFALEMARLG